jgi:hypothetical protein
MTRNYIPPAWASTIGTAIEAATRLNSDLDGRDANTQQRTRAGERYHKRVKLRQAALIDSIATHGMR